MKYCAIIGDVISSRKIVDRESFQYNFKNILYTINQQYDKYIASNFTLTLGDEFQGLLNDASVSYEIINKIKEYIAPQRMRFGIGIGSMDTPFDKELSIGSDGDAYRYARNMVDTIKRTKNKNDILIFSDSSIDGLINSMFSLINSIKSRRTPIQNEIIKLTREGYKQKEISDLLDKSQSTISQSLNTSLYYQTTEAEKEIKIFLSKLCINYRFYNR